MIVAAAIWLNRRMVVCVGKKIGLVKSRHAGHPRIEQDP